MKKLPRLLLSALFLSHTAPFLAGQTAYYMPKAVSYCGKENDGFSVREFRPFGWSQDGKFAYAEVKKDKRYGDFYVVYRIVDTITDEVAIELTDRTGFLSAAEEDMAEASWKARGGVFSGHLIQAGIRQRPYTFLPSFPLTAGGRVYRGTSETSETGGYYSVFVQAGPPGGEVKSKRIGGGKDDTLTMVRTEHYCPSPYENRIVLIVVVETRMKEIYYTLMGCHLTVGY